MNVLELYSVQYSDLARMISWPRAGLNDCKSLVKNVKDVSDSSLFDKFRETFV